MLKSILLAILARLSGCESAIASLTARVAKLEAKPAVKSVLSGTPQIRRTV